MSGFYISNNPILEDQRLIKNTGWEQHSDTAVTVGSPLVISQGTRVALPNNGATADLSQSPGDGSALYDGGAGRVTPNGVGDAYCMRVSFAAFTSSNNGGFEVALDISAAGDGGIVIAKYPVRMLRGTGAGNTQLYDVNMVLFSKDTFLANGGTLLIESVTGDLTLYDISYLITKTHKGV